MLNCFTLFPPHVKHGRGGFMSTTRTPPSSGVVNMRRSDESAVGRVSAANLNNCWIQCLRSKQGIGRRYKLSLLAQENGVA